MTILANPGTIGQIKGPFTNNEIINFSNNRLIKLGISIGEKDLLKIGTFMFKIQTSNSNEEIIYLGREGIYELTEPTLITSITFPLGAPESIIIDYTIFDQ